jgi:hypothetical protein
VVLLSARNEKAVAKTAQRTTQILTLTKKPSSVIIRTRGVEPCSALLHKRRPEDIVRRRAPCTIPSGITQRALDYLPFPIPEPPKLRPGFFNPDALCYVSWDDPVPNPCESEKIEGRSKSSVFSFDRRAPALPVIPPSWHTLV